MKIENSKIFITGGAGFIGSHLVEELVKKGAKVTVYDNFSFGKRENLSHIEGVEIIEGDILDFEKLKESIKGQDIVSHQAAQLEIFLSEKSPKTDLELNTIGTLNVLKAAKENNVSMVLNASSGCVYGQADKKTNEDDFVPTPNWSYGVSKLAAEKYATIYNDYKGLPVVSFRYSIVYGEREWFRRVLTIFIKRAILGKSIVVFEKGDAVRDFVYVKDLVDFHNLCIEKDITGIYNIGTEIPTKIYELAEIIKKIAKEVLNKDIEIIYEDTAEGEFSKLVPDKKRNSSELKLMLLDIEKAKSLGWSPKVSLEEGIKNEFMWAKDNLSSWEKIVYS